MLFAAAQAPEPPASSPDLAQRIARLTPSIPACVELVPGALRYIGCNVETPPNGGLAQAGTFRVEAFFECLPATVSPFERDLIVTLGGVDIARVPVSTAGFQPGEVFTRPLELFVPRCVPPGAATLTAGLANEKAPGESRRGLIDRPAELARVDVVESAVPASDGQFPAAPKENLVVNGGFEQGIGGWNAAHELFTGAFGWARILSIAVDDRVACEGKRSLRLAFGGGQDPNFYHVTQIVDVDPGARYRLEYAAKTEALTSHSLPVIAVGDADRPPSAFYAAPEPESAPQSTQDWKRIAFEFTAPPDTRRVVLRISRSGSGPESYDPERFGPIGGTIWFDRVRLDPVGRD
jgi:hypothetical protein